LPYKTREILEKIKSGKIKMALEHKRLDPFILHMNESAKEWYLLLFWLL